MRLLPGLPRHGSRLPAHLPLQSSCGTWTLHSPSIKASQVILLKLLSLSNDFVQRIVPGANDGAQEKSLASVEHITTFLSTMNRNNIAPFNLLLLPPEDFSLVFNHLCLENPGISATTLSSSHDTVRELLFFGI